MDQLSGLAKIAAEAGLLDANTAVHISKKAADEKQPFAAYATEKRVVNPKQLAMLFAKHFGLPYFDLNAFNSEECPQLEINPETLQQNFVTPLFKRGRRLFVGVIDPANMHALDSIKFQTNLQPEAVIVEANKIAKLLSSQASNHEMAALDDLDINLENLDIISGDPLDQEEGGDGEDAPIIRFINKILLDAVHAGASDLHFEPYEKTYRVRFRRDGILYQHIKPPQNIAPRLAARLKVMSQMDISERRVPQDGRFKMRLTKSRAIDFRVSTCPTLFGEKVVMRILDPTSAQIGIDALGYEPFQKELFLKAIHKPQGMVLVTGPTGSGKTVSLYTALNILNTDERNISTAEDPVEINLSGINQVNVNIKAGLTFASALRAFLRQDPDIVMVGEIRDIETAEIAVKAAQTGHMVLSTLHTNSAADTLTRMINMGVPAYNLATSVSLIIAQRLARKLCDACKEAIDVPKESLIAAGFKEDDLEDFVIYHPKGCDQCKNGYTGRVGLYEVMPTSPTIGEIIMAGGNAIEINKQAQKEGVWTLREAGLRKVKQGLTSLEEISRVTKE